MLGDAHRDGEVTLPPMVVKWADSSQAAPLGCDLVPVPWSGSGIRLIGHHHTRALHSHLAPQSLVPPVPQLSIEVLRARLSVPICPWTTKWPKG